MTEIEVVEKYKDVNLSFQHNNRGIFKKSVTFWIDGESYFVTGGDMSPDAIDLHMEETLRTKSYLTDNSLIDFVGQAFGNKKSETI